MFQVVNWSSAFHEQLQSLQYSVVGGLSLPLIDTSCLSSLFDARFTAVFDGLDICPRLCNSAGAVLCVYSFVSLQRPIVIFSKKPLVFRYHWCVHFSDSGQEVTIYPV